ncbi:MULTISPECIES: phosphoserine phosphatase SerB [unclassified Campylobacter]|uniref:phosphoserine phosphatase SerB n=1 Tax=unclassified Campylobacter TaxID=2593542 RepID=UPI001237F7DA|nr:MULTISPECIES: phosphoserine phosphatase SerB [unclassified Campylobacter]KAA6227235.1 phosphoserine phosphatase SerB [Campylobacter sp. LR286c]KAA6227891.1 phosphoserine phosphatase SerB [Campylobacter sp. LR185c]KAA6228300.1 phosphoserine phosphatase SerB [Campylobacter sp. LR196d]KAA6229301.1 phosphoserine phosphatase SerB [Campylobacter sp. LR291e]KAA6231107.1 phosphoserine phosphatase SerB [Campylobacter sp. LR264d]
MIKLCVFDFDSTLMDGETIDIFAGAYGVGDEVKLITHKAMNGEFDFFESLTKRVSLLKGMPYEKVLELGQNLPLMNGANELLAYLTSKNILSLVLSGGFHEGIDPAMKKLNFNLGFANYLHHKDGFLTGLVGGEMMFSNSKGLMIRAMKNFLKLNSSEVACVGDGANDLAMFEECGLKIAFCAKAILKEKADICVDNKDLKELIRLIK